MSEITQVSEKQVDGDISVARSPKTIFGKEWQLIAKILELVFCALCLGTVMEPAKRGELVNVHLDHFALIFPTFIGYTLITSVYIAARVMGEKMPYRTGFLFSVLASCLFFASGILLAVDRKKRYFHDLTFYEPKPYLLNLLAVSSAFSFFSSILFAVEAVYTWKYREEF